MNKKRSCRRSGFKQGQTGTGRSRAIRSKRVANGFPSGGWKKKQTGGVDWTKCKIVNGTRVCLGVEIQVSGRSDLVVVDLIHLIGTITKGQIDVGVLIVPDDILGNYLADRAPHYSAVARILTVTKAEDYPIIVLAIRHDGSGPALTKQRKSPSKF